jgi:hypothetical protein
LSIDYFFIGSSGTLVAEKDVGGGRYVARQLLVRCSLHHAGRNARPRHLLRRIVPAATPTERLKKKKRNGEKGKKKADENEKHKRNNLETEKEL